MRIRGNRIKALFAAAAASTFILCSMSNVLAVSMPIGRLIITMDVSGYTPAQNVATCEISNWRTQYNLIHVNDGLAFNPTRSVSPNEDWLFTWDGDKHFEITPCYDRSKIVFDYYHAQPQVDTTGLRLTVSGDSVTLAQPANSLNQKWDIYVASTAPPSSPAKLAWTVTSKPNIEHPPQEGDLYILVSTSNGKALVCQPSGQGGVTGPSLKPFSPGSLSEDMLWDFYLYGAGTDKSIKLTVGQLKYTDRGVEYMFDVEPYIDPQSARTMVPIRFIAEALGARVDWIDSIKTDYITLGGKTLSIVLNKPLPDGMGTAVIVKDRLFVPIRYVSEQLGATVGWDDKTKTVTIA